MNLIMNEQKQLTEFDADKLQLLVDSHHGVYCPEVFIKHYEGYLSPETKESFKSEIVSIKHGNANGDDSEDYWDSWMLILDNAVLIDDNGQNMLLIQDGDVWAYPEDMESPPEDWYQ